LSGQEPRGVGVKFWHHQGVKLARFGLAFESGIDNLALETALGHGRSAKDMERRAATNKTQCKPPDAKGEEKIEDVSVGGGTPPHLWRRRELALQGEAGIGPSK
jgi:hypothetical protein